MFCPNLFSLMQQTQKDNALISCVFVVYAPRAAVSQLSFSGRLPLFVRAHEQRSVCDCTMECDVTDILPRM